MRRPIRVSFIIIMATLNTAAAFVISMYWSQYAANSFGYDEKEATRQSGEAPYHNSVEFKGKKGLRGQGTHHWIHAESQVRIPAENYTKNK